MKNRYFDALIYLIIIVFAVLLFFGGPDYHSSRSFKSAWNLGHIIFYTFLTAVLLHKWGYLKKKDPFFQLVLVFLISFFSGLGIEWIQVHFSRIAEFGDLWRNTLGALAGWLFFSQRLSKFSQKNLLAARILLIFLIFLEIMAPVSSLRDEYRAYQEFPIFSDFERKSELKRWESDNRMSISNNPVCKGDFSCRVLLTTEKYSGIFLKYFPKDWSEYNYLKFSIYNTENEHIQITCRIHDRLHVMTGEKYEDRFNKRFKLIPGWNHISISLDEVREAPLNRRMQLDDIFGFGLFSVELKKPVEIYIDDVRLSITA
ncbi:MAG: VanZ family protein [Calditrichaeota bacterium]|nr:VanZ family protein [Calditrichota bacterium]